MTQALCRYYQLCARGVRCKYKGMKVRIKTVRESKGLTQVQLAEMAGLARSYLSELESGKKVPNLRRLEALANAMNCDVHDLLQEPDQDFRVIRLMNATESLSQEDYEAVVRHAESLSRKT